MGVRNFMFIMLAYVDPTAGGMLLQIILGGAAGILLVLQVFWKRIARVLGFGQPEVPPAGGPPPETPKDPS